MARVRKGLCGGLRESLGVRKCLPIPRFAMVHPQMVPIGQGTTHLGHGCGHSCRHIRGIPRVLWEEFAGFSEML